MKTTLGILLMVLVLGALSYTYILNRGGSDILADTSAIRLYKVAGRFTGFGLAEISYKTETDGFWYANVFADFDNDGKFSSIEWLVKNKATLIRTDYVNRFNFIRPINLSEPGEITVFVGLSRGKTTELSEIPKADVKKYTAELSISDVPNPLPGSQSALQSSEGIIREIKRPLFGDFDEAFSSGDKVEIKAILSNSRTGRPDAVHYFKGAGVVHEEMQKDTELTLAVEDPALPAGADFHKLILTGGGAPHIYMDYPLWDGIVIIDSIYIQGTDLPSDDPIIIY